MKRMTAELLTGEKRDLYRRFIGNSGKKWDENKDPQYEMMIDGIN